MAHKKSDKKNKKERHRRAELRKAMVEAYGGQCKLCGETDILVLVLDHINDDGSEDRKKNGHKGGAPFYARLKKQGWPSESLQLLCCNCNARKEMKRRIG